MARPNARNEGTYFPLTRETPYDAAPLEPESEAVFSASESTTSFTPRGQRFSKLSEAYLRITSRQGLNDTAHKFSNQSQSSAASVATLPTTPPPSGASLWSIQSQDDLQIPTSASAVPTPMKKSRRASFNSIEVPKIPKIPEDLPSKMGGGNGNHLSLGKRIDKELRDLEGQPHETTDSTIDGILDQYDGPASGLKANTGNTQEYRRTNAGSSISQPPSGPLPELPSKRQLPAPDVRHSESDSPAPDSSISDSQYLLDAEAHSDELTHSRQALVPLPLNVSERRQDNQASQGKECADPDHAADSNTSDQTKAQTDNTRTDQDARDCREYLQPRMERAISQKLKHVSGTIEDCDRASHGSGHNYDIPARRARNKDDKHGQLGSSKANTGHPQLRDIKVVLGSRRPETGENQQKRSSIQVDGKNEDQDKGSDISDWVTEATSDSGLETLPECQPSREFKKAGSSIADYSDDGRDTVATVDTYGSRERIIRCSEGSKKDESSSTRYPKESKFAALVPRFQNGPQEATNRRWVSTAQQGPTQFRPQDLRNNTNPYRQLGSGRSDTFQRLAFDFDKDRPPRFEFRDSVSEYEPATASTKANCGTHEYNTRDSLPSPAPETKEDAPGHCLADSNDPVGPPDAVIYHDDSCQTPRRSQDNRPSIYEADRQKQLEEHEFAVVSSYEPRSYEPPYEPPSVETVKSKFDFELVSLDQAQKKLKEQRASGETNKAGTSGGRINGKQGGSSFDPEASPLVPPPRTICRALSTTFTAPDYGTHDSSLEDTPTPLATGRPNERRGYRRGSWQRVPDTPSTPGTPYVPRRLWYGQQDRLLESARKNQRRSNSRPVFVAPDHYTSAKAKRTQQLCFYILAALSIMPFFGILVLTGAFSEALKWATKGEIDRLTHRQRRFIKCMFYIECIAYTGAIVAVVIFFTVKGKA